MFVFLVWWERRQAVAFVGLRVQAGHDHAKGNTDSGRGLMTQYLTWFCANKRSCVGRTMSVTKNSALLDARKVMNVKVMNTLSGNYNSAIGS